MFEITCYVGDISDGVKSYTVESLHDVVVGISVAVGILNVETGPLTIVVVKKD